MKVPVSWLKEFVPLKATAEEIARRLTFAGLEVEGIEKSNGEAVLEVNVTPNRGDGLSVLGIAREASALFGVGLRNPPNPPLKKGGQGGFSVTIRKPQACPRYMLAVIDGVRIGPSPVWLVRRLEAVGVRPINNVVDATNFILMGYGQPLHAFDRGKIRGGKILVRTAASGERIRTLDGQDRELQAGDLVIADAEGPIALAGIVGGKDSEVEEGTTSIAIECAFFEPGGIRKTARRLGLQTESSYRFERRVDPEGLPAALSAAVRLILDLAGGRLVGPVPDLKGLKGLKHLKKPVIRAASVTLSPDDVNATLGVAWDKKEMRRALGRLSFGIKEKGSKWTVSVPSYRGDVARPVDVIEEVARIIGYDRIPTVFPPLTSPPPADAPSASGGLRRCVKSALVDLGLRETIHYSFLSPNDLHGLRGVPLANPLGLEFSVMRPSLLPSLLKTVGHHQNHKIANTRFFELRKVFAEVSGRIEERRMLAGVLSGARLSTHWSAAAGDADFYDAKGVVERILDVAGLTGRFETGSVGFLHPRRQARVTVGGKTLGVVGEIHPDLVAAYDLKKTVTAFELDWELVAALAEGRREAYQDFGRTPVVERDLAVVLDEEVPAGSLQDFLRAGDPTVQEVGIFDVYRGQPIPPGKKSLAFSIKIGRVDRTLTDEQVNEIYGRLVEGVKKSFNAEIRT